MKTVTIYTDGACSGNPGPGGWGAILMYGPHSRELSGGEAATTNNRMELTAVIQALSLLKEPCIVDLWSDSKYVIDGLEKGWAKGWKARGWKKADKKPALNPDLWDRLLSLTEVHSIRYHWVKGHAENAYVTRYSPTLECHHLSNNRGSWITVMPIWKNVVPVTFDMPFTMPRSEEHTSELQSRP